MQLDECSVVFYNMYAFVRNQVIVSSMGDVIDLNHQAVLGDIKLDTPADEVKKTFERVLECFNIEREFA